MDTIVVETKISFEDYRRFTWYAVLKKGKRLKTSMVIFIAAYALSLMSIIYFTATMGGAFLGTVAMQYLLVAALPLVFYLLLSFTMRQNYKKSLPNFSAVHRYEFGPEGIKAEAPGTSLKGSDMLPYEALLEAVEVKDSFYLFISRHHAHLISKKNLGGKDVEQLRTALSSKLGEKFVSCI